MEEERQISEEVEQGRKQKKREIPPLYESSGDKAVDQLQFFHILERLKVDALLDTTQAIRWS